tara:strand:+ start:527 stop:814 length:288 start_codon:yes stop_codon:yes gene_type:complete
MIVDTFRANISALTGYTLYAGAYVAALAVSETSHQGITGDISMPRTPPGRTIPIYTDASFSGICTSRRTMGYGIHKQDGISSFKVNFYRSFNAIN